MKTCEVCGRPIRTGRIYCREHRRTKPAGQILEDQLLHKAQKLYYQRVATRFVGLGLGLLFLITYLVFLIGGYGLFINTFILILFIALTIIYLPIVFKNRIMRSEKCDEYIKKYLGRHKDEGRNGIKDDALR